MRLTRRAFREYVFVKALDVDEELGKKLQTATDDSQGKGARSREHHSAVATALAEASRDDGQVRCSHT
jgi:hypothetical protein